RPLPIGYCHPFSQPFIVALTTDLLQVGANDVVLEIGTGSGYQAAVLARLARQVHTIEIIPALADAAAQRLARLGYVNVATRQGDGYYGWQEAAPFDGIMVTAAASQIPPPLIAQLKPSRRMVERGHWRARRAPAICRRAAVATFNSPGGSGLRSRLPERSRKCRT